MIEISMKAKQEKQKKRTSLMKKLFAEETNRTLIQFFRYCFVGGGATVVDWGISTVLFFFVFGQRYAIAANVLSFVAGLLVNYFLSTFWIFRNSKMQSRMAEFLAFAAIGVVGLLITAGVTKFSEVLLGDLTSAYQILGKIAATAIAFFWNFFARKYLIFQKKDSFAS